MDRSRTALLRITASLASLLLSACGSEKAGSGNRQAAEPQAAGPAQATTEVAEAADPAPSADGNAGDPDLPAAAGPCFVQDGKMLDNQPLRAVGTEPFWAARIEGRCITYSHPDDQQGTRVWTRFDGSARQGIWAGALAGKPFRLATRPQPGCSDGMSDNRYPIAVSLSVAGEQRSGCAHPL